ncbi:MAG TPA: hypothetical protein GX702_00285 [Chloroflexi bacterium]|nr:hypothetical protein [Chloroflexota bacterium]
MNEIEIVKRYNETFAVEIPLRLQVDGDVGTVEICGTDEARAEVEVTVKAWGQSEEEAGAKVEQITVDIEQGDEGQVQVRSAVPGKLCIGRSPNVAIRVHAPRQSRVQVVNQVGQVLVSDIEGALDVRAHVGEIKVDRFVMTGDSTLRVGVGTLRIGLTADGGFNLDARADIGSVRSDPGPLRHKRVWPGIGDHVRGPVGDDPHLNLTLRANTGAIRVLNAADEAGRYASQQRRTV